MQKQHFKVHTSVYSTRDYHLFNLLTGNRETLAPHLKKLKESMSEKYLLCPIIVNDKMEVIDGQHRLKICKDLNLPVYFIVAKGYGIEEVQRLNINHSNWKFSTYLDSYCEMGYPEYLKVKEFKDRFGFDDSTTTYLLSGNHDNNVWNNFKTGNFKIKNYNKAVDRAEKIMDFEPFYKGFKRIRFVKALIRVMDSKGYIHDTMLGKMKYLSTRLVDCVDIESYEKLLRDIYNYRSRSTPI